MTSSTKSAQIEINLRSWRKLFSEESCWKRPLKEEKQHRRSKLRRHKETRECTLPLTGPTLIRHSRRHNTSSTIGPCLPKFAEQPQKKNTNSGRDDSNWLNNLKLKNSFQIQTCLSRSCGRSIQYKLVTKATNCQHTCVLRWIYADS